jgi:hypothetical protein
MGAAVARRRRDHRTWDELSVDERRRGLVILAGMGVVTVGVVFWVFGGTGGATEAGAPAPAAPAVVKVVAASDAEVGEWLAESDGARRDIVAVSADVRSAIAANNGMALQPACALLSTRVAGAAGVASPPAGATAAAWSAGLDAYGQAARWCAQLFDGTPVPASTLLGHTGTALDTADGNWTKLAAAAPATLTPSPSTAVAAAG